MDLDEIDAAPMPGLFKQLHVRNIIRKHSDQKISQGEGGIPFVVRCCKKRVVKSSRRKEDVYVGEAVTGTVSRGS